MKAHYNKFDKNHKKKIRNEVAKEFQKQSDDMARRFFKLFCVALHQEFGFGKDRFTRVIEKIQEISSEREQDEVFWSHIDIYCKHLGFEFPEENYERMDG